MANTKQHPALGRMTKGLGGKATGEGRGGPGTGSPAVPKDSRTMSSTAPAGGRVHPSVGGNVPRVKNPQVGSFNTVGGKKAKTTW